MNESVATPSPARACLRSSRPNFLVLAPLCVGLAITAAWADGHAPDTLDSLLVLLGALLAHAAVNLLNEHHDYHSGLDAMTQRTPFSGGSGALPSQPQAAAAVWKAAMGCLVGVVAIGLWFLWRAGPVMLVYGLLGLALVVAYTGWLTRRPWLCLLAPGVGFGLLMVLGAYHALTGGLSATVVTAALIPTLMVSALLLINQLPDIDADRRVGRDHLAIRLGPRRAARLGAGLMAMAFAMVPLGWSTGGLPVESWLMWLALPTLAWLVHGLWRLPPEVEQGDLAALLPLMGLNVALLLVSLTLLNLGLVVAA